MSSLHGCIRNLLRHTEKKQLDSSLIPFTEPAYIIKRNKHFPQHHFLGKC